MASPALQSAGAASVDGAVAAHNHPTTTTATAPPSPLVSPSDVAAAVAAAASAAGLVPPTPGVPVTPYDPARAQAVADGLARGTLAGLAALARPVKWVVSVGLAQAGSGAGVHVGSATTGEAGDGGGAYGVGGDGLEGVVSVWWARV
jgi:hypothetical protein